ncbi:Uncharacterised protein [Mycobacteroides abscessus subsp. abscessus]|nr:Uncharacterised protein [Mycobacteroides abscessus subsp. abscessus]
MPTITPRNLTSDRSGKPSPMLTSLSSTRTKSSSLPCDFTTISTAANEAITAKHRPMTPSLRSVDPRGSWSNELAISHRTLHR